ncbi:MAG: class I SAM-dependent methyltransferase [Acidimicrobiales bacterium]
MVHDAAATGFGSNAEIYAGVRPSYHLALVERFVEAYGRGQVVELGAGTGIFTHQLLDAGVVPVAIEPVAAMRDQLAETCAPVVPLDGTAEETGLPDDGADTVVVAQAFHWFDHGPALDEIRRVLRRGGHLVCVWNVRDTSVEWVRAVTDIVDRYAGDTPRHRTMAWRQAIDDAPGFELVDDWSIENPKPSTPQGPSTERSPPASLLHSTTTSRRRSSPPHSP